MFYEHLIHQSPGSRQLRQMAAADRLPHANLLLGPPGGGGLATALATASLLLCENRQGPDADTACGQCRACRKSSGFVHPDLHFVFPTIGTKVTSDAFLSEWRTALRETPYQQANEWLQRIGAENKQGNITRDECGAILRKLSLKIFEGRYKIMLIWLPEYLGNEGNRLLKMIEEPPERTVFLLVSERIDLILNTILSRCQLTKLGPPNSNDIAAALERSGVTPAAAATAARLADGNYSLARQLTESADASYGPLLLEWIRAAYRGSPAQLIHWTNDFAKLGRENQKHFLRYGLHFWREFLLLGVAGEERVRLPADELASAKKLLPLVDHDQLADITGIMSECAEYVERNANPKILFLDAGLRLHQVLRRAQTAAA